LSNYLALEKIRLNEKAGIKFEIKGDIKGIKIPPMLLIPFVENCFKHGNIGSLHVYIYVEVEDNNLYFYAENNKPSSENSFIEKSGIGMENIQRRLDLLFEDHYSLEIEDKQGRFIVNLHIDMQD
jgi:LytS/YehU family sensor histidine kinase